MLAQATALLFLVAKELRDREPLDRFLVVALVRADHARQRRCHFRAQRDGALAFVDKVVELTDDFLARFLRVQIQRLERWTVVLAKPVATRGLSPLAEDVSANGHRLGIKVPKAGEWVHRSVKRCSGRTCRGRGVPSLTLQHPNASRITRAAPAAGS